jgi:sterol desaturase/sphingolipid hydroxylase (fatty acid hydroxylase superfamily)
MIDFLSSLFGYSSLDLWCRDCLLIPDMTCGLLLGLNSVFHDMHHEFGDVNFGIIGLLDKLQGTYPSGRKKKRSQKVHTERFKSE